MKILIEKRTVDVLVPAATGRNSARLAFACLGQEFEVDPLIYRQWRKVIDRYEAVQREMAEVVG